MRRVVAGVGNAYRGDDGAGLEVAARLRGRLPEGTELVQCVDEPSRLIDSWRGADVVIVVDAVASGVKPGTVYRFDASDWDIPEQIFRSSTHAFGVGQTVALSRALGHLPPRVIVYGIEGADFDAGEGLTDPVAGAVDRAVDAVLADIKGGEG